MGRKPLSSYPPEVAAKMRADYSALIRKAWTERESNGLGVRKNGALLPDVQAKIAESVRRSWADGDYDERVNGMSGKRGSQTAGWTWGKCDYAEILRQHEDRVCRLCGSDEEINAHHVDEDHDNYLLTNLLWACVPCHAWKFHYRRSRLPFVEISRRLSFEYAHVLPWHPGKCAQLHGHSGHLELFVRGRLDPNGVVMDFKDLGEAAKMAVFDQLDHRFLNDYVTNPTSENLLVWVWRALEDIGLKGLSRVTFSETDSSTCSLTAGAMIEAFGWDHAEDGPWRLVGKPNRGTD